MMAENGRIRPSDMGGPDTFKELDKLKFGACYEKPPDLTAFSVTKPKQPAANIHPLYEPKDTKKAAKTAGQKFLERQKLNVDREKFLQENSKSKQKLHGGSAPSSLSLKELVAARESARQAYSALKEKRNSNNSGSKNSGGISGLKGMSNVAANVEF